MSLRCPSVRFSLRLFVQRRPPPLSWLSCSGISPPSPFFFAASSTSQTRARASSAFLCLSPFFLFSLPRLPSLGMYLPTNTFRPANTPPRSHGLASSEPDVMDEGVLCARRKSAWNCLCARTVCPHSSSVRVCASETRVSVHFNL